jgi:hypothetical protein
LKRSGTLTASLLLRLSTPAQHDRGPRYMAQVLASLHAVTTEPIFFEYGCHENTAALFCRARRPIAKIIERQLAAAYPDLEMERVDEGATAPPPGPVIKTAELRLIGDVMPIETCDAFEDRIGRELNDPIAGLLGLLAAGPDISVRSHVAIQITPTRHKRCRSSRRVLNRYYKTKLHEHHRRSTAYLAWATSPSRLQRTLARLLAAALFMRQSLPPIESTTAYARLEHPMYTARIFLMAAADSEYAAQHQLDQLTAAFAPFTHNTPAHFRAVPQGKNRRGSILSVEELAILFHPTTATVKTERMEQVGSRRFEPPATLPPVKDPDSVVLGTTDFRRRRDPVALRADDRRRHLYCVGKTGVGKSTLLLNLITDDIQKNRGVGVIDPHGDLIADVLKRIPKARTNDVILFDPAEHPIAFNPLACSRPEQRPLVAAGVLSAMKKVFDVDETNAPRMLYILRNVLLALMEQPQATLLDVPRMLTEQAFRRQVISRLSDPLIISFWQNEFANWNDRYRDEAIAPIQNKVGQFLTSPLIRHVFASPKNALDLRRNMDTGKILLVNLSHGRLGEDSAALLGALLVTSIEQAAKSRADIPEDQRRDFYLYADEFQTYAGTESLSIILSQARKYRLSLCLANQLVGQMDPELVSTVFGNVGSLCVMQVGRTDAEKLAEELGGDVTPEDLIALPKYHAVLRMLIDGEPTRPFTIHTLPPPSLSQRYANANTLVEVSSRRYATT